MTAEKIGLNPLGYKIGERAISTNPDTGYTSMFEWEGEGFSKPITSGWMEEKRINSSVDAVIAARQVIRRGGLIQPCEQVKDKRVIRCPYMDPTGLRHCTHEDGLLPKPDGGVECPLQRGGLKFIDIVDNSQNGHYNDIKWSPKWANFFNKVYVKS